MTRVLVVEDDDALRMALVRMLEEDFEVATAADGVAAVLTAHRERPDVVLLDLGLPAGDGQSVLARYREIPALAGTPVVVYTGAETEEIVRRLGGFEQVAAVLRKPLDRAILVIALQRAAGVG